ncbi:Ankyrin repeat domain-containing protein 44 [Chamberlinius hualienensis]
MSLCPTRKFALFELTKISLFDLIDKFDVGANSIKDIIFFSKCLTRNAPNFVHWIHSYQLSTVLEILPCDLNVAVLSLFITSYKDVEFLLSLLAPPKFGHVLAILTIFWGSLNKKLIIGVNPNALLIALRMRKFKSAEKCRKMLAFKYVKPYNRLLAKAYTSTIILLNSVVDDLNEYGKLSNSSNSAIAAYYLNSTITSTEFLQHTVILASFDCVQELKAALLRLQLIERFNMHIRDSDRNRRTVTKNDLLTAMKSIHCAFTIIVQSVMDKIEHSCTNPNASYSLLGICVFIRHLGLIDDMIRYGAEVNPSAENVVHPFLIAVHMGYDDVCRLLINSGAVVNLVSQSIGFRPGEVVYIHPRTATVKSYVVYVLEELDDRPFWESRHSVQQRRLGWVTTHEVFAGDVFFLKDNFSQKCSRPSKSLRLRRK